MDTMRFPQGDIMNEVERGSITKSWNAGLRNPQAKKLTVDTYNSGCVNPHGCVPGVSGNLSSEEPGFRCTGAAQTTGPALSKAYDFLNAPFLSGEYEFLPPKYMQGVKDFGPNSVTGWAHTASGGLLYQSGPSGISQSLV
jgi:hypothetical protein